MFCCFVALCCKERKLRVRLIKLFVEYIHQHISSSVAHLCCYGNLAILNIVYKSLCWRDFKRSLPVNPSTYCKANSTVCPIQKKTGLVLQWVKIICITWIALWWRGFKEVVLTFTFNVLIKIIKNEKEKSQKQVKREF